MNRKQFYVIFIQQSKGAQSRMTVDKDDFDVLAQQEKLHVQAIIALAEVRRLFINSEFYQLPPFDYRLHIFLFSLDWLEVC